MEDAAEGAPTRARGGGRADEGARRRARQRGRAVEELRHRRGNRVVLNYTWVSSPKWLRMSVLTSGFSLVGLKKKTAMNPREGYELAYAAPKFDDTELIIEEIRMGRTNGPRAEFGSKVTVKIKFISENSPVAQRGDKTFKKYDLILGDGKVFSGLHKGIIGMRRFDIRKIIVPPSICNVDESICESTCEVQLLSFDEDT